MGEISPGEFFAAEWSRFEGLRGVPGAREIHPFLAQGAIAAAAEVKDFAEGGGVAAVVFEELWQCHDIGQAITEERAVVGDAGLVGAETG